MENETTFIPENANDYPPGLFLLMSRMVDMICSPGGYNLFDWRRSMLFSNLLPSSWLDEAYRVPFLDDKFPAPISFTDFIQQQQQQEASNDESSSFLSQMFQFAFATPNTSLGVLTTPTSLLVLLGLVLLMRQIKAVLYPLFSSWGRRAGRSTHGPEWESKPENKVRIYKFGEYVFRLCYHSVISVFGIWLFFGQSQVWNDSLQFFDGYPHLLVSPGMAWYYLIQSAYNLEALFSLLELSFHVDLFKGIIEWAPTVRGDFREMAIHHLVTNALVLGSSYFRFTRLGSIIFLLHDLSDIPVDLSKLANFVKWKITTMVCFVAMVLSWFVCRLVLLPFWIFKAILYQSVYVCNQGDIPYILYATYQPFFVVLLTLIITLHMAWFAMFLQIGYLLAFKGEAHDLSEHKKGEKEQGISDDKDKKKNDNLGRKPPPASRSDSLTSSSTASTSPPPSGKTKTS